MNVVMVVTDDQPADGDDPTYMPWLNAKSDGNWVKFTNTAWHHPLCGPCRAAFLTGLASRHAGMLTNGSLFDESKSLPIALQQVGVVTGLFGKYMNGWPFPTNTYVPRGWSRFFGNDGRGYFDYDVLDQRTTVSYGSADADYSTDVFFAKAVEFVNNVAGRPFFCYVAPYTPHTSGGEVVPAPRHTGLYPGATPTRRGSFNEDAVYYALKPEWLREAHPGTGLSAGTVTNLDDTHMDALRAMKAVDEGLEDIRDALNTKGVLDQTVIIFCPDNGNLYGEHREDGKDFPYEESIRRPLWIRYPGATQADNSTHLVSNLDVCPTIAEAMGARLPVSPDGMSLVPILRGTVGNWRDEAFCESMTDTTSPPWRLIRTTAGWKYVEYYGTSSDHGVTHGQTELYDTANDPYELVNLTDDPDHADRKADLAARLQVLAASYA